MVAGLIAAWARKNPGDFYKIAARLIPAEGLGQGAGSVTVIFDPPRAIMPQLPQPQ